MQEHFPINNEPHDFITNTIQIINCSPISVQLILNDPLVSIYKKDESFYIDMELSTEGLIEFDSPTIIASNLKEFMIRYKITGEIFSYAKNNNYWTKIIFNDGLCISESINDPKIKCEAAIVAQTRLPIDNMDGEDDEFNEGLAHAFAFMNELKDYNLVCNHNKTISLLVDSEILCSFNWDADKSTVALSKQGGGKLIPLNLSNHLEEQLAPYFKI